MALVMFLVHIFTPHTPAPNCRPEFNEHHSILITGPRVHCMECDLTVTPYV